MHLSTRGPLAALCAVLASATATLAQVAPSDPLGKRPLVPSGKLERSSSKSIVAGGKSSGGETKSYRRVVRDGVVIEEEGRPLDELDGSLRDGFDAGTLLDELRRKMRTPALAGGDTSKSSSSHTRRVVVVNGETIVDEEFRDGKPVRPGVVRDGRAPDVGGVDDRGECRSEARAEARAEARSDARSEESASSDDSSTGDPAPLRPLSKKALDPVKRPHAGDAHRPVDVRRRDPVDPKPLAPLGPSPRSSAPSLRPSKAPAPPRRSRDA